MDNHQGMAAKASSIRKQHSNVQFEKIQDCLREFHINLHFTKIPVTPNHFLEHNWKSIMDFKWFIPPVLTSVLVHLLVFRVFVLV
jgi:hypothetical protein